MNNVIPPGLMRAMIQMPEPKHPQPPREPRPVSRPRRWQLRRQSRTATPECAPVAGRS